MINSLIEDAWRLYHRSENTPCVVKPSIPILYFGDCERYARSPLKVITVGLNPSRLEFPADGPFRRFPQACNLYPDVLHGCGYPEYLAALNDYFRRDPYLGWFGSLEPLLEGMEASFREGRTNVALHTDLCSPLATDPTWSRLTHERSLLGPDGIKLWLRMVRHLVPDVVLVSVAREHLAGLDFVPLGPWQTIFTVERARPYRVEAQRVETVPGRTALVVFGQASQMPFGTVSFADKREIGRTIAEQVGGR